MSEPIITPEATIASHFGTWINNHFSDNSRLKKIKAESFRHFEKLGFPAKKSETYKYTPITRILDKNFDFNLPDRKASWTKDECQNSFYAISDANHLVFINGLFAEDYSLIKSPSSQLQIRLLDDQAFEEHPEIADILGKTGDSQADPFAALNLSYFVQGLYIRSAKNSDNLPVFIYHFVDASEKVIVHPRILVMSAAQSKLHIYEKSFIKGDSAALSNHIFEAEVKENAELSYTKLQNHTSDTYTVDGIYAHQERDSRFYTNTYSFKGALIRNNLYINVDGENCEAHMNGLYQVSGHSHVDNNTTVDHRKPHSFSNELYKGIINEQARAVFNGKIYVRPDAQKTNAFQANNNILLSDMATVNTKPQLEIWADDVKCSHGCTTGQLDKEAIFYLRSRGIEKNKARAMMLNAFAKEALDEVRNDIVKTEIEELILNRLDA